MQIEEGKYYRTGDGERAGPAEFQDEGPYYSSYWKLPVPSYPAGLGYDDDGKFRGSLYPGKDLVAEWEEPVATVPEPTPTEERFPFQQRVGNWMIACFGEAISADRVERADRFIEESLELAQAGGYSKDRAHALVDYVFNRDQGEINQETGGVMVTLAAYCNTFGIDMQMAAEDELARVWTKVEAIREKQRNKPTGSALPIAVAEPAATSLHDVSRDLASMTDRAVKAEAERDKWHRKAMDAGVIVHSDGSTSHPMRQERDELRKAFSEQADEYLAETDRLRGYIKAHCEHETKLAAQIDAMTDTASIYRAECERLKKREAELLEANNGYLERARAAEAALASRPPVIKPIRPKLRDCPMCGADGKNDEKVAVIEHSQICDGARIEFETTIRCLECGVSVSDEYESEAVRLWNGKQNAEQCTACGEYLDEGDLVYIECGEGGFLHADCCDKSDVTGFTDEDGNPLQPGDKIPEPFAWKGGAA